MKESAPSKVVRIEVSLSRQQMRVFTAAAQEKVYSISTAANGAGEVNGSGCTPRGKHRICALIGDGLPEGAVFVGRRWTGEIYNEQLAKQQPQRDWILCRILWLSGCEPGKNRFGSVDTQRRFIYIHGTPDSNPVGVPLSHGCIRMRNRDLLALFESVSKQTVVDIYE